HARQQAGGKGAAVSFTIQWKEARNAWRLYVSNYGVSPASLDGRLEPLREQARAREWDKLAAFEAPYLVGDLHKTAMARWLLARAQHAADERTDAVKGLQGLIGDLA